MENSRYVYNSSAPPSGVGGERVIREIGHGITKTNKRVKNSICFVCIYDKGLGGRQGSLTPSFVIVHGRVPSPSTGR